MKLLLSASLSVLLLLQTGTGHAREITDMTGRKVLVPDRISRVYASSPPASYLLYAMDPTLIVGLNSPLNETEKRFLKPAVRSLPVIGSSVGQGKNMNTELLLKARPDIVLVWAWQQPQINARFEHVFRQLKIPVVQLRIDSLRDYPAALTFLGSLLQREKRAAKLRSYAEETLKSVDQAVAGIKPEQRPTVYYAEGQDGLATERDGSFHAELIGLAGGRNVHRGEALDHYGMEKISMEQVMLYNPQIMLAQEAPFLAAVGRDPRWKSIKAVRDGRVYRIPRAPFNWFDRPPSFMRLLGLRWLTNRLHPDLYRFDAATETRRFYRLFLGIELNNKDLMEILKQS
ncbi:iron complex transport system substrate-binding protein [Trichlorobacter thiogenes]|uniref:Iron complex transport system substrate-binding protein n=1 Tax=Trichlorobacter thiogenes TaxID=115783 RepID=A0A1T4RTL9_9BACT|nr:ABC transporter substrate-binding protein [Trichlorobacter thiogenes]SKA19319.1 iron complex transport system substrate-binding protein [Trichlorobacter thiogenes]